MLSLFRMEKEMFECSVFSKVRDTVCFHLNHYWLDAKVILFRNILVFL